VDELGTDGDREMVIYVALKVVIFSEYEISPEVMGISVLKVISWHTVTSAWILKEQLLENAFVEKQNVVMIFA